MIYSDDEGALGSRKMQDSFKAEGVTHIATKTRRESSGACKGRQSRRFWCRPRGQKLSDVSRFVQLQNLRIRKIAKNRVEPTSTARRK